MEIVFGASATGTSATLSDPAWLNDFATIFDALAPCIFRLIVLAFLTFSVVASVVCNALMRRVDSAFMPVNACRRAFTALLYAVFWVMVVAMVALAAVSWVLSAGILSVDFDGL